MYLATIKRIEQALTYEREIFRLQEKGHCLCIDVYIPENSEFMKLVGRRRC
jgi:hypothetical protein